MPEDLMKHTSAEISGLLERRPGNSEMPLSAQMAFTYTTRIPNVLRAVALLSDAHLLTEANAVGRVLVESGIKLAFILQQRGVGSPPVDRSPEERELRARELWDHERLLDIKVLRLAEATAPNTINPGVLTAAAEVRQRLEAQLGDQKDNRFAQAEAAGMEAEYRLWFGPMSQDAHATINAARRSERTTEPEIKRALVLGVARSAVMFLSLAAQLLGDARGVEASERLRLRLAEL